MVYFFPLFYLWKIKYILFKTVIKTNLQFEILDQSKFIHKFKLKAPQTDESKIPGFRPMILFFLFLYSDFKNESSSIKIRVWRILKHNYRTL